jgi:hypothetical protein
VYLDPEVALALRQFAAVQGRSQAELIRDALAAYTQGTVRRMQKERASIEAASPTLLNAPSRF